MARHGDPRQTSLLFRLTLMSVLLRGLASSSSITCDVLDPMSGDSDVFGAEFGLILAPGAHINASAYAPLAEEIQRQFPGRLWIGLTGGFVQGLANAVEMIRAVDLCAEQASAAGFNTQSVFLGGHSLGGTAIQGYILDHPSPTHLGLVLLGSYLFDEKEQPYPLPVLTAIGSIDGLVLTNARMVAAQARKAEMMADTGTGDYPVLMIKGVNHMQVASGPIPDNVIDADIDAEITTGEAHRRYAEAAVAFMVMKAANESVFDAEVVEDSQDTLTQLRAYTDAFLEPFDQMALLEQDEQGKRSQWMEEAQVLLLGSSTAAEAAVIRSRLNVTSSLVAKSDLGSTKPQLRPGSDECSITVDTFATVANGIIHVNQLLSADEITAKFKLESVVRESVCINATEAVQCAALNEAAFFKAWEAAGDEARDRFEEKGKKLMFVEDREAATGSQWLRGKLKIERTLDGSAYEVESLSLISPADMLVPAIRGMHYCHLLSPYRALEWIYIEGVNHSA